MRLLLLTPWIPYPPHDGGRMRVYELLRGLAAHHDVDLLALRAPGSAESEALAELRAQGFTVEVVEHSPALVACAASALAAGSSLYEARHRSRAFAQALAARLDAHAYDLVQCEFAYMAQHRPPSGPLFVLDEHNVEFRLNSTLKEISSGVRGTAYRAYARRELRRRRREELAACRGADHVIAVSDVDRRILQDEIPGLEVSIVPNGVDLDRFEPAPREQSTPEAVFVGKMDYRPNVDAARWFCGEILPRVRDRVPDFQFTIVGRSPARGVRALERLPGVHVTGEVPDTRPHLRRAALATIPLRAGSGTRLKVLEALAMGCAVVSTPLGSEGLDVVCGKHALLAEHPEQFAEAIVALLGDRDRRLALGRAGRRLVEERYGWAAITERLVATYAPLLEPAATVGGRA